MLGLISQLAIIPEIICFCGINYIYTFYTIDIYIFIITDFAQKLFDIGFLYKYCKVTPAHQHQGGVENCSKVYHRWSTEFHSMTYNYRIWVFFMIMYQKNKKLSWLICIKPPNIIYKNYLTLDSYKNTARSHLPTNPSGWCWKLQ